MIGSFLGLESCDLLGVGDHPGQSSWDGRILQTLADRTEGELSAWLIPTPFGLI